MTPVAPLGAGDRERRPGSRALEVGLLIYGSLERLTGGNLYDRKLVEEMERRGHRVEILSLPDVGYPGRLAHNLRPRHSRPAGAPRLDLLLQDELAHPSLLRLNRRRPRPPVVSIVHHLRSSEREHPRLLLPLYRSVERAYLRSVDAFVFNSQATRAAVEALLDGGRAPAGGSPARRPRPSIVATPGGDRLGPRLAQSAVKARAHEPGPLRLLFVGNLIRRKGLTTLLTALSRISDCDWRLEVIGGGDDDPALARQLARQVLRPPLAGRVDLRGRLDDRELARHLRSAQLLVVPSSFEGFGIVYLEGLGFGLPAIAARAGGAAEIVEDERCGLLLPPGDSATLAAAIERFASDRDRLERFSLAALERFRRFPDWRQTTSRIADFLERVASGDDSRDRPDSDAEAQDRGRGGEEGRST